MRTCKQTDTSYLIIRCDDCGILGLTSNVAKDGEGLYQLAESHAFELSHRVVARLERETIHTGESFE